MPDTTETTPRTPFPERMRATAVESHARRAVKALSEIIERASVLRDKLQAYDLADADGAAALAELAMKAGIHLSALEVLRETREWDEAERNALEPRPVLHHPAPGVKPVTIDARDNR